MNPFYTSLEIAYSNEMQLFVNQVSLNPWWISGLVSGEGCFLINYSAN